MKKKLKNNDIFYILNLKLAPTHHTVSFIKITDRLEPPITSKDNTDALQSVSNNRPIESIGTDNKICFGTVRARRAPVWTADVLQDESQLNYTV